ncbi:MAG TPA: hypothetical protein VF831_05395, partial [Anaerolineales bacterium]
MNSSLDLNLLLLARQGGDLLSDLPDLYAVTPPRRTARGREADSLIMYLSMTGNSPLTPEAETELLEQLAHKFYKTTGSLTAAMRTIVEGLNLYLLDRNLRSTSQGRQGIGQLLLVALRGDTLYIAQCGLVHTFVVNPKETMHLYDPQSSGRGLGFSRTAPIRFLQTKLAPGDYLVLATNASPNWSETTLTNPQGVEMLRNQLLETASSDINAVIVQAQAGTGKLRMLRRKAEAPQVPLPAAAVLPQMFTSTETPTTPIRVVESPVDDQEPAIPTVETPPVELSTEALKSGEPEPEQPLAASAPQSQAGEETVADSDLEASAITSAPLPEEINPPGAAQETPAPLPLPAAPTPIASLEAEPGLPLADISSDVEAIETGPISTSTEPSRPRRRERPAPRPSPLAKALASARITTAPVAAGVLRALRSALATIGAALLRLLKNVLPDED